jgi:shikimate 5-dehydrogenase
MINDIRREECGGCAVTMPIKTAIIPYLDELTPEASRTGAVNTIVKVPIQKQTPSSLSHKLIGTNTDILGVKNALLRGLRSQYPLLPKSKVISPHARYGKSVRGAGVVIGGGATTRSAAHALWMMGLESVFLVNRDVGEVEAVRAALPHIPHIIHLTHPDQVESLLVPTSPTDNTKPRILMMVGAIPAFAPITREERMVYTTVSSIMTIPYDRDVDTGEDGELPIPMKRLFLEMPYKPRITPMLQIATAHGWHPIIGIEAMIEQGLAQQRMWARGDASVEVGCDASILGEDVDAVARQWVANMDDIVVTEVEVNRADGKEAAPLAVTTEALRVLWVR